MRALDQLSKFCAKFTGGLLARPSPEPQSIDRGGNDASTTPQAKAAAPRSHRDDDRSRSPGVSHPAAWPR